VARSSSGPTGGRLASRGEGRDLNLRAAEGGASRGGKDMFVGGKPENTVAARARSGERFCSTAPRRSGWPACSDMRGRRLPRLPDALDAARHGSARRTRCVQRLVEGLRSLEDSKNEGCRNDRRRTHLMPRLVQHSGDLRIGTGCLIITTRCYQAGI